MDSVEIKLCKDCTHLIGVRYREDTSNWKCGHPENHAGSFLNLLTGIQIKIFKFPIDYLRHGPWNILDNVCGAGGTWFEKYEPPNDIVNTIGGQEGVEVAFDNDALEAGKKAVAERLAALRNKRK